jgi:hypothetical protein
MTKDFSMHKNLFFRTCPSGLLIFLLQDFGWTFSRDLRRVLTRDTVLLQENFRRPAGELGDVVDQS